jgi:ParB family transcriptional regulator, chromosome partitioning protein
MQTLLDAIPLAHAIGFVLHRRARFARHLEEMGYVRDVMMSALALDKTTVSRMISVTTRVPPVLVEAIGPAPGTGRYCWVELATICASTNGLPDFSAPFETDPFQAADSDKALHRRAWSLAAPPPWSLGARLVVARGVWGLS